MAVRLTTILAVGIALLALAPTGVARADEPDLLAAVKRRREIAEQQAVAEVRSAVWRAVLAFPSSPRQARKILTDARAAVYANDAIGDDHRQRLLDRFALLLPDRESPLP